ncbi:MAG: dipeptide ABC transporter ATP-binding protein [Planctomycetota bacterium]
MRKQEHTSPAEPGKGQEALLRVEDLSKQFLLGKSLFRAPRCLRAVDEVSFAIESGETLGLVGESGCGKTTLGRIVLRLLPASGGRVHFSGKDLFALPAGEMRALRREMQIIFQDPYSSLNPRMTAGSIVGEGLKVHGLARGAALRERVCELLMRVGLDPSCMQRYPHEFSGGQRQRIGIARALSVNPRFIVCDEPVSALDVSIQAQVINLLMDLRRDFNLSYLFISHDLSVVRHISHKVAVMYLGRIVEMNDVESIFDHPRHPYTRALISAVPVLDPAKRGKRILLKGEVPSPIDPPPGCPFHTRCPEARPECSKEAPPVKMLENSGWYRCILDA